MSETTDSRNIQQKREQTTLWTLTNEKCGPTTKAKTEKKNKQKREREYIYIYIYIYISVFPTEHFLRTCTQVRDKCTQVHDQNRSSKFAKSALFRADKPFLSEKNRSKSEFTVVSLVANRRASIDRDLAYEVEMLAFEHSVGYELRGKLGVPLRFLSRTAQPPQHAINFLCERPV